MNNIDKLKRISTPAEENWFEIAKEWEREDKEIDLTTTALTKKNWLEYGN